MSSITKLDKPTIRRITSGQVITDLCSVLKELVENALDANSHVITVRLNNFGLNKISVEDDGTGIALGEVLYNLIKRTEEKMQECNCKRQHKEHASRRAENAHKYTSAWTEVNSSFLTCRVSTKLYHESNNNNDVHSNADCININYVGSEKTTYKNDESGKFTIKSHFDTLGFRGEALYSLATMSHVNVLTMWEDSVPYTVEIRKKDTQHTLEARLTNSLKSKGTTVIITDLFIHFPVRRLDLERNCRKQMSRAVQLLRQYAVSHANVKLNVLHQEHEKAAVQTLISTTGSCDLLRSVTEVYGGVRVAQMHPVQWNLSCGEVDGLITNTCHVERTGNSEQILVLNGRAVDLPIVTKAINDACSACCSLSCKRSNPSYFLRFNVNDGLEFDVNLSPNKRKIAIVNEDVFAREVYNAAIEEFRRNMEKNNLQSGNSSRQYKAKANNLATLSTSFDHDKAPAPCAVLSRYTFRIDTDIKTREESKSNESCGYELGLPLRLLSPYLYCCDDINVSIDRFKSNIAKINNDKPENDNAFEYNGEHVHMSFTEFAAVNTEMTKLNSGETALMQCVAPTDVKEAERDSENFDELKCKYQRVEYSPSTLEAPIITSNDRYCKSCVDEEDRHTKINFSSESQTCYMTEIDPKEITAQDENQKVITDEVTNGTLSKTEIVVNKHTEQLNSTVLATEATTTPAEEETVNMNWEREPFITDEDNVARKAGVESRLELTKSMLKNITTLFCPFEEVTTAKCETNQSLCNRLENTNNEQNGALLNSTATFEQNATFSTLLSQSESELSTYFHKRSFNNMRVIGQFNQGFIISLFNHDLFVIDQHASDEKYNFEQLLHSYKAKPQRLVKPVNVQMELFEVELACAHKGELMEQGFEIDKHPNCETQIIVKSIPVLPYDVIQPSDVMELIEQLSTYGAIVNPLRAVWHSMATKACRSSIMIGTALTPQVMQNIIIHLASLEEPWHCPHGRPTMRHLGNIDTLIPK